MDDGHHPKHNATSFRPGHSGNPGGKPKTRTASALARRYTVDAIRTLVEVVRLPGGSHAAPKIAAARTLLEIAYPGIFRGEHDDAGESGRFDLLALQPAAPDRNVDHLTPTPNNEDNNDTIDAGSWVFERQPLPEPSDDLPDEALPLWDAYKARKSKVQVGNEDHDAIASSNGDAAKRMRRSEPDDA